MVSSARSSKRKRKSSTGNDTNWQRFYYSPIAPCSPVAPSNEAVPNHTTQVNADANVTDHQRAMDSSSVVDPSRGIPQVARAPPPGNDGKRDQAIQVNADEDLVIELHQDINSSSVVDPSRGIPPVATASPPRGPCSNNGSSSFPRRPYPGFHPNHLVIPIGNGVAYNNNGVGGQYRPNFVDNNIVPRGHFPDPYIRGMNEPPPFASPRPMPFEYRPHFRPYGGFRPDLRAPPPPAYPHYRYGLPARRPPNPYGGLPEHRPHPRRYVPPRPRYF